MNNRERFLDELKGEYDKQFELKARIEGKAGSLLTVCGITIPLLFGFSSFLIEKIDKTYYFINAITRNNYGNFCNNYFYFFYLICL